MLQSIPAIPSPLTNFIEILDQHKFYFVTKKMCQFWPIAPYFWLAMKKCRNKIKKTYLKKISTSFSLACIASVSVGFRRKEQRTRVKDRKKSGASKRARRGWWKLSLISYPDLTLSLEMWDLVKFHFEHAQCQRGPKYGLFFHCACSYSLLWFWVILRNKHGFRESSWIDCFG